MLDRLNFNEEACFVEILDNLLSGLERRHTGVFLPFSLMTPPSSMTLMTGDYGADQPRSRSGHVPG